MTEAETDSCVECGEPMTLLVEADDLDGVLLLTGSPKICDDCWSKIKDRHPSNVDSVALLRKEGMVVPDQVEAPFTDKQVTSLNEFQVSGVFHPFTCGRCRDELGTRFIREDDGSVRPETDFDLDRWRTDPTFLERFVLNDRLLVATSEGWTCPTCDTIQLWAWTWMADDSWRQMRRP